MYLIRIKNNTGSRPEYFAQWNRPVAEAGFSCSPGHAIHFCCAEDAQKVIDLFFPGKLNEDWTIDVVPLGIAALDYLQARREGKHDHRAFR